jgi:hypothetical protein
MVPIVVVQSPNGEIHYCNNLTPTVQPSNIQEPLNNNTFTSEITQDLTNIVRLNNLSFPVQCICMTDIFKNIYILGFDNDEYINIIVSLISLIISINGYYATIILHKRIFVSYLFYNYINVICVLIMAINFNITIYIETIPVINNTIYSNDVIRTEIYFFEILFIKLLIITLLQKYYNYMPEFRIINYINNLN